MSSPAPYGLCRHFIDEYLKTHPEFQLVHRDLTAGDLPQLTGPLSDQREEWPVTQPDDPLLSPAREVAGADVIVIGAPYWDLTFPAALKVYLEWASLNNVTFRYTDRGQAGGPVPVRRPDLHHHRRRPHPGEKLRL